MLKLLVCAFVVSSQAQQDGQIRDRQIRLDSPGGGKGEAKQNNVNNNANSGYANAGGNNANIYNSDPKPLKQNSVSVGLFKNGYAFYVRQCEVSSDGVYILDLPSTVHGTLSVSSPNNGVSISTQYQRVSVAAPLDASSLSRSNLQTSFAGKQVTLQLKDSSVTGTLAKLAEPDEPLSPPPSSSYSYVPTPSSATADFLVLEDAQGGLILVDPSEVISFKVQGAAKPMRDDQQLTITVQGTRGTSPIQISYLSYGLTWAPSYYLNITDPSALSLSFQATIRNQGPALNATELSLITGFPNLQFQSVSSLLSSDLNTFIRDVNSASRSSSYSSSGIMTQSVMSNSAYGMSQNIESNQVDDSDGGDVLYQSIGGINLPAKSAVMRTVSSASVPFQQVVDWDASETDAWDAVRFTNPLSSAITTAPASVVQNSRLLGQSTTTWTPPKGLAIVRTSKALSVRVWKSETQGDEQPLAPAKAKLTQVTVDGILNVVNTRNTNITMCLNYGFDGVLVAGKGNNQPKVSTVEGGSDGGLNPHTNVNWEFFMGPGAKASVPFSYTSKKRVYY